MILKFIKNNPIISLILFFAFFIRAYGVYPGYPQIHPDEGTSYYTAIYLLYHWFEPDRFDYPAGVPFIHAIIYSSIFIPAMLTKIFILEPFSLFKLVINPGIFFAEHRHLIFGEKEIYALYWSRYISAIFGTLSVALTYFTAKRLFNKETGLFAAFFLAFNFRHVLGSHFGLPDAHSSFFSMLTLFASVLLFEKNTRQRYIFAGIAAGLTFSLKYQPFAFLPFLVTHIIWVFRKKSILYLFHPNMILGGLCIIATFLAINPYYLFNIGEAMFKNNQDYRRYQMGIAFLRGYPLFYLFHWGIGKLPFITICIGIVTMLFTRPLKFLLPFSFAFVVMFFMTYYSNGGIYPRNFVSVMPFLMIFAGFAISLLYFALKKFLNKRVSAIVIAIIVIAINFSSIINSFTLSHAYSKPWTMNVLSEWLEKNMPRDVVIRKYPLFLPSKTIANLRDKNIKQIEWSYGKGRGANTVSEFQQEGTDFAILNTYIYQSAIYYWREFPRPEMYLEYDGIPFDYIESFFEGITIEELMQYTVFESYKPWQAQEASNFIVFKIPKKPTEIGNKIKEFNFDRQADTWKLRNALSFEPITIGWDGAEGKGKNGSLLLSGSVGRIIPSRAGSEAIPIEGGKLYTVKGWIKNTPPKYHDADENGYLRMDFYKGNSGEELDKVGIVVSLTNRAKVTEEGVTWFQVEGSIVAPSQAKYLTISFQPVALTSHFLYLDDVELYESDKIPEELFKDVPYIKSTIPKESLYFNSFL